MLLKPLEFEQIGEIAIAYKSEEFSLFEKSFIDINESLLKWLTLGTMNC